MYLTVYSLPGPDHDSSVAEWMYPTVCPPCGPSHDSSVREWTYLIVCPLHSPGHGGSVAEWIYLTVCPPCGPSHDSSVGEWTYLTVCSLQGPGSISSQLYSSSGSHMMFIISSIIQTCLLFMNTSELTVKWRLVWGLWCLSHVSPGVKQLLIPATKPLLR